MPPREINLNGSDVESEIDEDELEVFEEEESDYSSEENTVQSKVMLQEPLAQKIQVKATNLCIGAKEKQCTFCKQE